MSFTARVTSQCILFALAFAISEAHGAVVTIDATITAIDAKERPLAFRKQSKSSSKIIELEFGKNAKVLFNGKPATLADNSTAQCREIAGALRICEADWQAHL